MATRRSQSLGRASTLNDLTRIKPLAVVAQPKKPPRVISVYYYPNRVLQLKVLYDKKEYISAGGLKEILNDILRIEQCYTSFFGIFSGTLEHPQKLLLDSEILPENISQFTYQKLNFNIKEAGLPMIFDRHAEELLFLETLHQFSSKSIVPQPDLVTQQCINKLIKNKNVSTFWRLLNYRSPCISFQSIAICQKELSRITISLENEMMVIRIGLDLEGIHFFDMEGETLIMSWPWTTIASLKTKAHQKQLFMFDIVVQERDSIFLRTIIVQTPACEYLLSVAKYILKIHQVNPEVPADTMLRGESITSRYMTQFKAKHYSLFPYSLVNGYSEKLFRDYAREGYTEQVQKELNETLSNHPNLAYIRPMAIYLPEKKNRLPKAKKDVSIESYKVYYYSKLSNHALNVEPHSSFMNSYVVVHVATETGRQVTAADVKSAIAKSLNLSTQSLKYFALFANIIHKRIDILKDEENMPTKYLGLCFRTVIVTWKKDNNLEQWSCLTNDDKAASLVFWEVAAGHGSLLKDPELILTKFMYRSAVCHILYALGSIVDLYYADDCKLLHKLVTSTNIQYDEGTQVIISLDEDRLYVWENISGRRIISFSWFYVIGIRLRQTPKLALMYTLAKGHESGYNTFSVQTNSAPFLFSFSQKFSSNVDTRIEGACGSEHSGVADSGETSTSNEDTSQTVKQEYDSEICKEMIVSLMNEAECYAQKKKESDSIWRLIERIDRKILAMPSSETAASRKWWSQNLFYRAGLLLYPPKNTTSDRKGTESSDEHVIDNDILYYQPRRWGRMVRQSGPHVPVLIEPRTGFRSHVSLSARPQLPMNSPPPPYLCNLLEIFNIISTNGKQFLNCFVPTRTETAQNMPDKKSSIKALNFKFMRPR